MSPLRNPSAKGADGDGFREELNPSYGSVSWNRSSSSRSPRTPCRHQPRRRSLEYDPGSAIRASIFLPKRRSPRPKKADHLRQRHRPPRAIRSTAFSPPKHIIRDAQIPIAPAAPPHVPPSRFLSLEAFGHRPPRCAAPPSMAGIRNPSQKR